LFIARSRKGSPRAGAPNNLGQCRCGRTLPEHRPIDYPSEER